MNPVLPFKIGKPTVLLWDGWWQGNICLFLPSHKFHPHGQAWLSGSSITFLCFNTFWKSLQQLTKWMEVVRHRTSGKVLSHRHILRVTDDDDDCCLWSEVCQHRDHCGSVCGHCSLEARAGGWERDWHGLGTEYSSDPAQEDQNRLLGAGTEHRGAGVATSGWEPGSSKWRLIVREVSTEPGPDRAAAANPDQRGERGNWPVQAAGGGPGLSGHQKWMRGARPSQAGAGRRIQQVTIRWLERGEERVTNLGITRLLPWWPASLLASVAISAILISGRHQWLEPGDHTGAVKTRDKTSNCFHPRSILSSIRSELVAAGMGEERVGPALKWSEVQTRNSGAGCRPPVPAVLSFLLVMSCLANILACHFTKNSVPRSGAGRILISVADAN